MLQTQSPEVKPMRPPRTTRHDGPDGETKGILEKYSQIMEVFALVNHAMPSSYIRMFLKVAQEPGKGISEYARDLQVYQAVASRILLEIGPKARTGGEGLGLVFADSILSDMRSKQYYLTDKGLRVVNAITGILSKDTPAP